MSKIDLSSKQWCDLVFEGRNREYGAYKLRAEQGNRNKIALYNIRNHHSFVCKVRASQKRA